MNKFSKVESQHTRSAVSLYIISEQSKKEIKKTILFTIVSKRMKNQAMKLTT